MACIGFDGCGYKCFEGRDHLLFSEDDRHEYLFNYVVQDLSRLLELFDQYISKRINISTFTLYDCPDGDTIIDQMKRELIAAHPYYKHEIKDVLIKTIGDYFNDLLLYSCYCQRLDIHDLSKEWYIERMTALLEPLLELGDPYPQDFYNEYQKQIGEDAYTAGQASTEIETVIYGVPREMPIGFSKEIRVQSEIYNMLYFLLDISAQGLDELTTSQRIWLYSNIVASNGARITVPKRFFLKHQTLYRDGNDCGQSAEYNRELYDKFRQLHTLNKLNVGRDGLPADMEEIFRSAIDHAKAVTVAKPYEEYEINSLHQLLFLEIWSMLQDRVMIRKCRRCGKYFVVANRRIAYCDRIDSTGVRCSVIGSQQSFQKKMENDEPLQAYNRAYKTHHARVRKGSMSKDDFQRWCGEAKLKLAEARAGKLDIAHFQEWLKK